MRTVDAAGLRIGDGQPPRVMGVLNVSRESPYDPSVYDDPGEAAMYVDDELIGEGADIVDIGLESANKRLDVLSAEEELERLDTAVDTIESVSGDAVFSIETRYASVAAAALDRGFDMVNDICGFADPEMPEVCREYDVAVGKMASPPDLSRPGAVDDVDWVAARSQAWADSADYVDKVYAALEQNGMTEKTILDPAFGGWSEDQTLEDDHEVFRRLREFRAFGRPLLVSINRKNFLREIADRSTEEALPVSLAATSMAVERGAHVIRTHDVAETRDAALIGDAFTERASATAAGVTATELEVGTASELERYLEESEGESNHSGDLIGRVIRVNGVDNTQQLGDAAERAGVTIATGTEGILLGGAESALAELASLLDTTELDAVAAVCQRGGP
ncbi:dihydropteroate synthase [Halovenus rubra]|uniref:Dihydropteroate synthase n=2 Tax=Halovenus rubra TaxID=869890 RepID=A0ACC7E051_9EURY|nr:dihydropteroate synthase [Halovenus rubra]